MRFNNSHDMPVKNQEYLNHNIPVFSPDLPRLRNFRTETACYAVPLSRLTDNTANRRCEPFRNSYLQDAILTLRALTGNDSGKIRTSANINGTDRITLKEVAYILQVVSELR